ncbi:DUF6705 family protein [Flavobacterium ponti]|uniref:DUF6705 family protein n=1 Tax=Flavobacterium ponti TaxID=665133 RepID=A0ABV9P135_9FLAO
MSKKIILIALLFFCFAKAQEVPGYPVLSTTSLAIESDDIHFAENGNYAMDTANERDQYVGTWQYNQNGTLFIIKIEKRDQRFLGDIIQGQLESTYSYIDEVRIRYKLVINGVLLYDNLNETNMNNINTSGFKFAGDDYLSGNFIDKTKNVGVRYQIYKTDASTPETIIFKADNGANFKLGPDSSYTSGEQIIFIPLGETTMIKID